MSKYINPYTDFGFKRLFGTEGNKDLLVDFLNCLMPAKHQIIELNFRNVEQPFDSRAERKAIDDVLCKGANGDLFIVKMQKAKLNFFRSKPLFYINLQGKSQVLNDDLNLDLLPVYHIAILDFPFNEQEEIRKFDPNARLLNEDGFIFYEKLGFRFLQMPFFNKKEDELVTHYDKWCYFLKHLENFDKIPDILNDPIFDKAFKTAELDTMSHKEWEVYQRSKLVYLELKAVIDTAKEEGREIGIKQGIAQWLSESELIKASKIANEMKDEGETMVRITKYTKLSKEDIEKL